MVPKRIDPERNRGGTWITFGEEEYRVPALGFSAIVELQEKIEAFRVVGNAPTQEQVDTTIELVWRALKRNYPKIARDEVADMIDMGNFAALLDAVLAVSGFVKGTPAPGESVAPTGTASTPP